jgi:hypothetical protein
LLNGNQTNLKFKKNVDKGYNGMLIGKLIGEDATFDVTVYDAGKGFDIGWEQR